MKKRVAFVLALLAVAGISAPLCAQPAADTDAALTALAKYKFGEDRSSLAAVVDALKAAKPDAAQLGALEAKLVAMLDGDATADAKNFICRELVVYGSAACVPALTRTLANPEVATTAIWALENIPAPEAADALAKAVLAPGELRVGLVQALGRRGVVAPLEALLNDADATVAEAAANALGTAGTESACVIVMAKRASASGALRAALDRAYLECADGLAAQGKNDAAVTAYRALISPECAENVRSGALSGLVKALPDESLDLVLTALADADPAYAGVAQGFIPQLKGEQATQKFADRLAALNADGQVRLIQALQARGDAAAGGQVAALAGKGGENVQFAAIEALGVLGDASVVPLLCGVAAGGSPKLGRAARESLDRLPGKDVNGALRGAAGQGNAPVRAEAIAALGRRFDILAKTDIMKFTTDKEAPVRTEAYKALHRLGNPGDLYQLFDRLEKGPYKEDRPEIEAAVAAICQRVQELNARAMIVLGRFESATDKEVRLSLLRIIGQLPTPASLHTLRTALNDKDPAIRQSVLEQMGHYSDGETLGDLQQALDGSEKAQAFDALLQALKTAQNVPPANRAKLYAAALLKATEDAQVKRALSGLGELPCIEALQMTQECRAKETVRAEADLAALKIAGTLYGAYPEDTKKALEPLLAASADAAQRAKAEAIVQQIGCAKDYITAWELSGPYSEEGKNAQALYDIAYAPEKDAEKAAWRIVPMADKPEACWSLDLEELVGGAERVVYLRTNVKSPADQEAILAVGSNDGVKVWWNGAMIHGFQDARPLTPDQDKLPVQLKAGWNTVMLAVYQRGGAWGACSRMLGKDGQPLSGLAYAVGNPQ